MRQTVGVRAQAGRLQHMREATHPAQGRRNPRRLAPKALCCMSFPALPSPPIPSASRTTLPPAQQRSVTGLGGGPLQRGNFGALPIDRCPGGISEGTPCKGHGCARTARNALATQKLRGDMCACKPSLAQIRSANSTPREARVATIFRATGLAGAPGWRQYFVIRGGDPWRQK